MVVHQGAFSDHPISLNTAEQSDDNTINVTTINDNTINDEIINNEIINNGIIVDQNISDEIADDHLIKVEIRVLS
jgi:hypothetical protein